MKPDALEKIESTDIQVKRPKLTTVMSPKDLAQVFISSGLFKDTTDVAKATVKILMGQELGISPLASMTGIHIIQGKCQIGYTLVGALIQKHPDYSYRVVEQTKVKCSIEFLYQGSPIGTATVDLEEAKRRGVQNLEKMPDIMLFARAMTKGARMYCAEVFGGVAIYDEGEIPELRPAAPSNGVKAILQRSEEFSEPEPEHFYEDIVEAAHDPEPIRGHVLDPETGEYVPEGTLL